MLTDLPSNCASDQSPHKKDYGIQADAGLRDRSWRAEKWGTPAEVQSRANVANSRDNAGENSDAWAQAQSRKNNKDEEYKHGRTGQRAISDLHLCTGEEGDGECRY